VQVCIFTVFWALFVSFWAGNSLADHQDGSDVSAKPSTDIANVYAWMEDNDTMNLIMTVHPNADTDSEFSTEAKYVFHINNSASYGTTQTETTIECYFGETGRVTCEKDGSGVLVSDVNANIPGPSGVGNTAGTFRIITRLAKDPSFRDKANFNTARAAQRQDNQAASNDSAQCHALLNAQRDSLLDTYTGEEESPENAYQDQNILAIAIQADTNIVGEGPVYGVYATTETFDPTTLTPEQ
jgi:hypothetical protein